MFIRKKLSDAADKRVILISSKGVEIGAHSVPSRTGFLPATLSSLSHIEIERGGGLRKIERGWEVIIINSDRTSKT